MGFGDYWFIMDDGMCDAPRSFNAPFHKFFSAVGEQWLESTGNYLVFKMIKNRRIDIEEDLEIVINNLKKLSEKK